MSWSLQILETALPLVHRGDLWWGLLWRHRVGTEQGIPNTRMTAIQFVAKAVETLIFRGMEESEYSADENRLNSGRLASAFKILTNEMLEMTVCKKRRVEICTDIISRGNKPQPFAGKRRWQAISILAGRLNEPLCDFLRNPLSHILSRISSRTNVNVEQFSAASGMIALSASCHHV